MTLNNKRYTLYFLIFTELLLLLLLHYYHHCYYIIITIIIIAITFSNSNGDNNPNRSENKKNKNSLPIVAGGWLVCVPEASMMEFRELHPTGGVSLSPPLLFTTCISMASKELLLWSEEREDEHTMVQTLMLYYSYYTNTKGKRTKRKKEIKITTRSIWMKIS